MERYRIYKITSFIFLVIAVVEAVIIAHLWIGAHPKKIISKKKPQIKREIKGKIAIVLDDWGYNLNNLASLRQIKYPLTLAVLPNLSYSYKISKEAQGLGFEVILHLPMEPEENLRLEQNTIMVSMDGQTVKNILSSGLESIVNPKGVSNHMGSKATKDKRVVSLIFGELKKRRLYFLDSFVTVDSVCPDLALKSGLRFAKRDVFIDNTEEPEYIKTQIYKLKMKAKTYGKAIGIGHDRKVTLQVLSDVMPELEKEGYKLVFLSELL